MADHNGLLRTPADTCGGLGASGRQLHSSGACCTVGCRRRGHAEGAGLKAQERRQDHIDHFSAGAVRTTRGFTPITYASGLAEQFAVGIGCPPIFAEPAGGASKSLRERRNSGGCCAADSMITGRSPACTDGCAGRSGVLGLVTGAPRRRTGVVMLNADQNQGLGMKRGHPNSPHREEWIKQQLDKFSRSHRRAAG